MSYENERDRFEGFPDAIPSVKDLPQISLNIEYRYSS